MMICTGSNVPNLAICTSGRFENEAELSICSYRTHLAHVGRGERLGPVAIGNSVGVLLMRPHIHIT